MRMELMQYLGRFKVEDFTLKELKDIFERKSKQYQGILERDGSVKILDRVNMKHKYLNCICKYYELPDGTHVKESSSIYRTCAYAQILFFNNLCSGSVQNLNCLHCHIQALEACKAGKLKQIKKINLVKKRILSNL